MLDTLSVTKYELVVIFILVHETTANLSISSSSSLIDCCFCNSLFCSAEFQKRGDNNGVFGTFGFVDDVVVEFSPVSKVKKFAGDEFFGLFLLLLFAMIFDIYI